MELLKRISAPISDLVLLDKDLSDQDLVTALAEHELKDFGTRWLTLDRRMADLTQDLPVVSPSLPTAPVPASAEPTSIEPSDPRTFFGAEPRLPSQHRDLSPYLLGLLGPATPTGISGAGRAGYRCRIPCSPRSGQHCYRVHLFCERSTGIHLFMVSPPLKRVLNFRPETWRASF